MITNIALKQTTSSSIRVTFYLYIFHTIDLRVPSQNFLSSLLPGSAAMVTDLKHVACKARKAAISDIAAMFLT